MGGESCRVLRLRWMRKPAMCGLDWIGLDWTATRANQSRKCTGEDRFNQSLLCKALVPLCTPCTNPPSPAPYGCKLELEGERCKTMDRIVIGGPFKTEELRPKGLMETK